MLSRTPRLLLRSTLLKQTTQFSQYSTGESPTNDPNSTAKSSPTSHTHADIQKSKLPNPAPPNCFPINAPDTLPKVGFANAPPEALSSTTQALSDTGPGLGGSFGDSTPEPGIGELSSSAKFHIESACRTGEDAKPKCARLLYQSCKCGILETDLLLSTFADANLGEMSGALLDAYDHFLDENDWDIYYWATQKPPGTGVGYSEGAKVKGVEINGTEEFGQGEWAQTVGRKREPYRPPPGRWAGSEILEMIRAHVKRRAGDTDGGEEIRKGLGRMPDIRAF